MIGRGVTQYADDQGFGTIGTDLFWNHQPDDPDNCIIIYDETAPVPDEVSVFNTDVGGIQILVRNTDSETAHDTCISLHKQIAGFRNGRFAAGEPVVTKTDVVTPPSSLGNDGQDRYEYTAHYMMRWTVTGNVHRTVR